MSPLRVCQQHFQNSQYVAVQAKITAKFSWSEDVAIYLFIANPTSEGRYLPTWSRGLAEVSAFLKGVFPCHCCIVLAHVWMLSLSSVIKWCSYITDLVLRLLESLHLRRVYHHAETFPFVLLKVLFVKSLKCKVNQNILTTILLTPTTKCLRARHEAKRSRKVA